MAKYVWKNEDRLSIRAASKADPQKIGEALESLADQSKGRLKPENIVEAARNQKHVLHPHFEWNDKVAGHQFRLQQARHLVSLIRVEDEKTSDVVPAFYSVSDSVGVAYRAHLEVTGSRELQLGVLLQAERDLRAFEMRYRMLQDVCELVGSARATINRKIEETRAT